MGGGHMGPLGGGPGGAGGVQGPPSSFMPTPGMGPPPLPPAPAGNGMIPVSNGPGGMQPPGMLGMHAGVPGSGLIPAPGEQSALLTAVGYAPSPAELLPPRCCASALHASTARACCAAWRRVQGRGWCRWAAG